MIYLPAIAFSTQFPIQVGTTISASGTGAAPEIRYEGVGINTDVTVRENEPAVVGSVSVGTTGDALILVVSVKQSP